MSGRAGSMPGSAGSTSERSARRAAITTQHGKERQFGPPLWRRNRVRIEVAEYDTDRLGTFTGTVERTASPQDVALHKAQLAVELTGAPIGIGSEGSFGPHPAMPFVAADAEVVVLVDVEADLEIVESVLSADTNYARTTTDASTAADPALATFLAQVGFPDHAVVVAPADPERPDAAMSPVAVGVVEGELVAESLRRCLDLAGAATVSTDMRAHVNPTRQRVLVELAERLAVRLDCGCPACDAAGWGITSREAGLVCGWCGGATASVAADVWTCARRGCGHEERRRRDGTADPGSCPNCNP